MSTQAGKAVGHILKNDAGVTAQATGGIYDEKARQNASLPYVVYSIISTEPHDTKDGVSTVDKVRIQINVWGQTGAHLEATHSAIRTALDRVTPGTYNTVNVDGCRYDNEYSLPVDGNTDLIGRGVDYIMRVQYD